MISVFVDDETKPLCEILQITPRNTVPIVWKREVKKVYMFSRIYPFGVQVPFEIQSDKVIIKVKEEQNQFFVLYSDGQHIFENTKPILDDQYATFIQTIKIKNLSYNVLCESLVLEDFFDLVVWTGFRTTWLSVLYNDNIYTSGPLTLQSKLEPNELVSFDLIQKIPIEQLNSNRDFLDVYLKLTYTQSPIDV